MTRGCWESGKHVGAVKRRRILRDSGITRELHTLPKCDRHYRLDLQRDVRRGKHAADELAKLAKKVAAEAAKS
jgi:hypothetical protein